ncbi:Syntaxin-17 [Halotydeus destructor]|nr:Syntaxin-17 [Halotydeus destructor]
MAVDNGRSKRRQMMEMDLAVQRMEEVIRPMIVTMNELRIVIDQHRFSRNYTGLHKEQLKANVAFNQLQNALRELQSLEQQYSEDESKYLMKKVEPLRKQIKKCLDEYSIQDPLPEQVPSYDGEETSEVDENLEARENLQIESDLREQRSILSSWKNLNRDLVDLNTTVNKLASMVLNQKETVDRIESNISVAESSVHQGAVVLSRIRKGAALPLLGAAVGTAVAGPLGMLVGFKIAAVACIGTAVVGYKTGKVAQNIVNLPTTAMIKDRPENMDSSQT